MTGILPPVVPGAPSYPPTQPQAQPQPSAHTHPSRAHSIPTTWAQNQQTATATATQNHRMSYQHPVAATSTSAHTALVMPAQSTIQQQADAAQRYHAQLVTYYHAYSIQGLILPTDNNLQHLAQLEAIQRARQAGVLNFTPIQQHSSLARSASAHHQPSQYQQFLPQRALSLSSSSNSPPTHLQQIPQPHPFAPYSPQPPVQHPHPQLSRSDSVSSITSSAAGSAVSIASSSISASSVHSKSRRPLPVPPQRSPNAGTQIPTQPPVQPQPTPLPNTTQSPTKRPLPQPRGPPPAPPPARKSPVELLREKMASLEVEPEPQEQVDRSSTPTPPLFVVSPSEGNDGGRRPPSPSISISAPPPAPQPPPPRKQQHRPQPAPPSLPSSSSTPSIHPRNDPSHPSHSLYHPSSSSISLEAGAVQCARCRETMFGRALMAFGGQWHPDCFRCDQEGCGTLLEHVQFEGRDDRVYCMVHYEELFASVCFQCKTPIADQEYLTITDPSLHPPVGTRTYHALHFFCADCGDPFVDPKSLAKGREGTLADPYMVHEGYAYCFKCDVRLWKPKCSKGCKKGIGGDWVEALGAKWHPECFCCVDCKKPFTGQYLLRNDGPTAGGEKAYCVACYEIRAKEYS
ncbi:hypothetical protein T439DRAFT_379500 [Meredithblackwellia eburnea MCA 4105]